MPRPTVDIYWGPREERLVEGGPRPVVPEGAVGIHGKQSRSTARGATGNAYTWVDEYYIPDWAHACGPDPKAIKAARKSFTERQHARAVAALAKD